MKIISEKKLSNTGKVMDKRFFLYEESKSTKLELPNYPSSVIDAYELLEGYELGTYEKLFEEECLFQWAKRGMSIEPTRLLLNNPRGWLRDIKIDEILKD